MKKTSNDTAILSYTSEVNAFTKKKNITAQEKLFNKRVSSLEAEKKNKCQRNLVRFPSTSTQDSSSSSGNQCTGISSVSFNPQQLEEVPVRRRLPCQASISSLDANSLFTSSSDSAVSFPRRTGVSRAKSDEYGCPSDGGARKQQQQRRRRQPTQVQSLHDLHASFIAESPKSSIMWYGTGGDNNQQTEDDSEIRNSILKQMRKGRIGTAKRQLDLPQRKDGIFYPEDGNIVK